MQMQMEREGKRNEYGNFWNGNRYYSGFCCDYGENDSDLAQSRSLMNTIDVMPSSPSKMLPIFSFPCAASSSPSSSHTSSPTASSSYIEHHVSKFDTLAGIAIKYGVDVADIKKMNGLVTDLQMFAHKSLHIPLPGRHPPSPSLSSDINSTSGQSFNERTPSCCIHHDILESFGSLKIKSTQSEVTSAMSSLQGYYGLKPPLKPNPLSEGCEMVAYRKPIQSYLEDGPVGDSNPPLTHHRKSRSLVGFLEENSETANVMPVAEAGEGGSDRCSDKLIRRRQKSVADFSRTPEMLLEDNSGSHAFSASRGKHLALRPNAAVRTALATGIETNRSSPVPVVLGDSFIADGFSGVRKSSSTPSLQDPDSSSSTSIWSSSMWGLKPDVQAFSTAAIAKPILEGLPNPITGRRNPAYQRVVPTVQDKRNDSK